MDDRVAVNRVLTPVDGTDRSIEAVEYAIAIAEKYDATLSVMYVFDEKTQQTIQNDEENSDDVAEDTHAFFQRVFDRTEDTDITVSTMTVYGFSTQRKMHHPGSIILDGADQIGSDFIIVPREPEHGVLSEVAEYVLSYASQPVLSV